MNVAIDYDGTYDTNPKIWGALIALLKKENHKVYCITKRYSSHAHDIKEALDIPIIFAKHSKIVAAQKAGIKIDIWIENNPASILPFNLFEVPEDLTVTDWAEKNAFLSERSTEMSGLYRTTDYPYVKEVLECFKDHTVKKVSLCWGSQTGKTTTILCGLGWAVDQAPAPVLWVWSNEKQARTFATDRLIPFCEDSNAIAKHLPRTNEGFLDRDRASSLHIQFDTCTLNMVGGQSQRNVRNYPVAYLLMDEIDVIPEGIRRDALDRVKGRRNYKVVQSSTPISENAGVWVEYNQGDKRKWFIPCPHCKKDIELMFRHGKNKYGIKWDKKCRRKDGSYDFHLIKKTAYYECQKCHGKITDADKIMAMRKGKWKSTTKKGEPNTRSYHLSSLYSPAMPFYEIAIRWLQANESVDGLRQFVTGWLAEPWKDELVNVTEEATKQLASNYNRGEIKGDYRLMGIDVQRAHFWYIIRGFDTNGISYLIDHGIAGTWSELDTIFATYDCTAAVVDTGYGERTQECYEEIYKRRRHFWGSKGWKKLASPYSVKAVDPFTGGNKQGKHKIRLLHIDVGVWGGELLKRRNKTKGGFFIYKEPDAEYLKQLNSKFIIEKADRFGKIQTEWRTKGHGQDHLWDCELYALCLSKVLGLGNITRSEKKEPIKKTTENKIQTETGNFW